MFFSDLHDLPRAAERLGDDGFYTGDMGYLDRHGRRHVGGRADAITGLLLPVDLPEDLAVGGEALPAIDSPWCRR